MKLEIICNTTKDMDRWILYCNDGFNYYNGLGFSIGLLLMLCIGILIGYFLINKEKSK